MGRKPKEKPAFDQSWPHPFREASASERPPTGYRGEDYREIIGRPDLGEEWRVSDPMQADLRPEKPKE